MKPSAVFCLITLIAVSLVSATGVADKSNAPNRLRTSSNVELYKETDLAIPQFVSGNLSAGVARGSELTAAISFLNEHRDAYRMKDPQNEMVLNRVDEDRLGMVHVRLDQYYKGISVYGGELLTHFSADGLRTVNGYYLPDIDLDTKTTIGGASAVSTALDDLAEFFGPADQKDLELVVFPWEGTYYLAWRTVLWSDSPMGNWEYFVDAKTGEVIFKANRIMADANANDIGTGFGVMGGVRNHIDTDFDGAEYRMIDYTRLASNNPHGHNGLMPDGNYIQTNVAGASLPGVVVTDADNIWDNTTYQTPAVDGHVYASLVYDWMLATLGRNSFDDMGATMLTSVNYYAEGNNNAYWNGEQIVVWSWSAGNNSLAACPDVIAHEWGHAVTTYTSNLIYQKESGALNESFSDMMGAAFEFAHDSLDLPDWQIGENISGTSNGFRSMMNPPWAGDPDIYQTSPYWTDVENCTPSNYNDYCGVHSNSGVGNKWFYLLSDGGSFNSVTVGGIDVENAMLVAYRANAHYWSRYTDYPDAAYGTILAANDLDPSGVWADEVLLAWTAVGVPIPNPELVFDVSLPTTDMIPYETPTTVGFSVEAIYGGSVVAESGQMHYSIDGGGYTAIPMTETTPGTFEVDIPQVECGSSIALYFSAEETTMGVFYSPELSTPYEARPYTDVTLVMENDLSTDPGWTTEGDWAYGEPTGNGGSSGGPDPTSGHTGTNVYGYNLSGDYPNDLPERHLTSSSIDCTGMNNTYLRFWRWLGVETPIYDHAYVRVSTDGSSWTTVWENPEEITDDSWVEMEIDISAVADNQPTVYLRWTMGTSDGGWISCGWNIDDIEVVSYDCATWMCGDFNGDENVTLSDITRMIDYVYVSHDPIDPLEPANVNGSLDLMVTLSDITRMIDHVYISHEPLECL